MFKSLLLTASLVVPASALACPGHGEMASAATSTDTTAAAVAEKDPTACAKKSELVGSNCSYTTGMMAQRVMSEGTTWSFTGTLAKADNELTSHVAAPFTVGPDGRVHVVANEILEDLTVKGLTERRVSLEGKRLEVDGTTYFVLTGFAAPNT